MLVIRAAESRQRVQTLRGVLMSGEMVVAVYIASGLVSDCL